MTWVTQNAHWLFLGAVVLAFGVFCIRGVEWKR